MPGKRGGTSPRKQKASPLPFVKRGPFDWGDLGRARHKKAAGPQLVGGRKRPRGRG